MDRDFGNNKLSEDQASSFGRILKIERERRQETLNHVSHILKIRTTILDDLERENYGDLPPEGYTQGMISTYARHLGLDPIEVLDLYHEGLEAYHRKTDFIVGDNRSRRGARRGGGERPSRRPSQKTAATPRDGEPSGRGDAPPITSGRAAVKTGNERHEMPWKLMLVAAAIVLIIGLGIWLLSTVFREDKQPPPPITQEETSVEPTAPAEALPSEEETDTTVQGEVDTNTIAGQPFEVVISVGAGESSWIEARADGDTVYIGSMIGPKKETFTVNEETEILVGKPSVVTITRDGKKVKVPTDAGVGSLKMSIDDTSGR